MKYLKYLKVHKIQWEVREVIKGLVSKSKVDLIYNPHVSVWWNICRPLKNSMRGEEIYEVFKK